MSQPASGPAASEPDVTRIFQAPGLAEAYDCAAAYAACDDLLAIVLESGKRDLEADAVEIARPQVTALGHAHPAAFAPRHGMICVDAGKRHRSQDERVDRTGEGLACGIAKGADTAVAFVLKQAGIRIDPNPAAFEEHVMLHMTVIAPCGRIVGHVEEVDVDCIKLAPIQGHYPKSTYVPWDWIERVDSCVYLNRDNEEITNSN